IGGGAEGRWIPHLVSLYFADDNWALQRALYKDVMVEVREMVWVPQWLRVPPFSSAKGGHLSCYWFLLMFWFVCCMLSELLPDPSSQRITLASVHFIKVFIELQFPFSSCRVQLYVL
uniref:KRAB domain-containing protein n=1 Tax=Podarcis muralis TaxID=64176 RepID=A0A670JY66_PODMU